MSRAGLLALLAVVPLAACDSVIHGGVRQEIVPTRDSLLSSHTTVPVHEAVYSAGRALPSNLAPLAVFDTTRAVGEAGTGDKGEGSNPLVFGSLSDAVVDHRDDILLLDPQYGRIRVFDDSLRPLGSFGRSGKGPDEFVNPQALLWLSRDVLGVYDPGAARIERFRRSGERFEPMDPTPLVVPPWPHDACGADDHIFVRGVLLSWAGGLVTIDSLAQMRKSGTRPTLGFVPDGFVHVLDETGRRLRSFSMPYRGIQDPAMASQIVTQGGIACAPGRVWVAYGILGEVHALTAEGKLLWITRISDLDFPGYLWQWSARTGKRLSPTGGLNVDRRAGDYNTDFIRRLTLLSPNVLAVDVVREHYGSRAQRYRRSFSHRTYLLDARTGEPLGAVKANDQILGGGHGLAVLYQEDPFPRVEVVRIGD